MTPALRVAIAHDYLTQRGGAERVVLRLAQLYPGAPVFTSLFAPDTTFAEFAAVDVRTSHLQGKVRPDRFRTAALRYPSAFARFDLTGFDVVIASSSGFAHHVRHPRVLVYCHTPPRFLYDARRYLGSAPAAALAAPALALLRRLDRRAAAAVASYAANSAVTAARIARTYGRAARVVHPPLWIAHLPTALTPLPDPARALVVARLLGYKRLDVAIAACALAGVPLTIVGEGPDRERLQRLAAGGDVTFTGTVTDDALGALFAQHTLVLVPGEEDFGFAPVEANHAGRPVVAYDAGGARETVVAGASGALVASQDPAAWADAIRETLGRAWDPAELRQAAARFAPERFDAAVTAWVADVVADAA